MQTAALARILATHKAPRQKPAPANIQTPAAPAKINPLLLAIARHARIDARTMMEMARDRDGALHPWR